MPIYEYQCDSCGTRFDAIQKFSDEPLTVCRACGAEGIRKLMSAPAFRLKGGGWYETDFKSNNQRNLTKAENGAKSEGGGSESKSDAKADAKANTKSDARSEAKKDSKPASDGGSKKSSGGDSGGSSASVA